MTSKAPHPVPPTATRARRDALLSAVRAHPAGVTIYGLARRLRRPYRRVFDAVGRLAAEGALRVEPVLRNNRRATLVTAQRPGYASAALPAHLSAAERLALGSIAARLDILDPRIETLALFGSRVRGESRWNSDLDLAVRVRGRRDPELERGIIAAIAEVEWSAPLEGALRISPLVVFDDARRAAIHAVIADEGVTVWQTHG